MSGTHQKSDTLIVDEADPFLLTNLTLRGVINSGHTRATAFVVRATGQEPRLFSTWGARMIALIGRLPATLEDRAIVSRQCDSRATAGRRTRPLRHHHGR